MACCAGEDGAARLGLDCRPRMPFAQVAPTPDDPNGYREAAWLLSSYVHTTYNISQLVRTPMETAFSAAARQGGVKRGRYLQLQCKLTSQPESFEHR